MTLSERVMAFCAALRSDLDFRIGQAEAHDALRAAEIVGIDELQTFRTALRLVCCSKREEVEVFDKAFDAFFLRPARGIRQHLYKPVVGQAQLAPASTLERSTFIVDREESAADTWQSLRARFSPDPGSADAPAVTAASVSRLLGDASALISSVRLGRLRRWRPQKGGDRFDMRRTLRASLHTGGDTVVLHELGHPLRNPRFVLLIDGSRSMA